MIEAILVLLIWICVIAALIYLVYYVLTTVVGLQIPAKIMQIVWVIFLLVVLLLILRTVLPSLGVNLP
jgi:uncharacterized membrane protein